MTRSLAITASLAAVGAIVGGLVGVVAIALDGLLIAGNVDVLASPLALAAAFIGGVAGVFLGPLAAWTTMRRAPIWKAIAGTAAGATIGLIVGYGIAMIYDRGFGWPIGGALLGFFLAAELIRVSSRKRAEKAVEAARDP